MTENSCRLRAGGLGLTFAVSYVGKPRLHGRGFFFALPCFSELLAWDKLLPEIDDATLIRLTTRR
jgi:hypothetical protein